MKKNSGRYRAEFLIFLLVCTTTAAMGQSAATANTASATTTSLSGTYTCIQRGPNSRVWQYPVVFTNAGGGSITNFRSYTEVATGLCYPQNGHYVDSVEQIQATVNGAQAVQGAYQVSWAANANTPGGAVNLTTPDSKQLLSTVFGLTYFDTASGSNILLAQVQDCSATIIGSNTLVYANAFSNLDADIIYTYRKIGLSQDLVLKQQLPSPAAFGLDPATTRLGLMTEFFNPPVPVITATNNNGIVDDRILNFGSIKMSVGHAFLFSSNSPANSGLPVAKIWTNIDNRQFLIEEVPYSSISNSLSFLHSSSFKINQSKVWRTASSPLPKQNKTAPIKSNAPVKMAKSMPNEARFVLDYVSYITASNAPSMTFRGDTTYYVSDEVGLDAGATFEGGTVIKFTNSSSASISFNDDEEYLIWNTQPYLPAIFTSSDDNSIGLIINGSSGNPSTTGSSTFLISGTESGGGLVVQNARFSYANVAVESQNDGSAVFFDCQFYGCKTNIFLINAGFVSLKNVLAANCGTVMWSIGGGIVDFENITVDNCAALTYYTPGSPHGGLTNSILTSVGTGYAGITVDHTYINGSSANPFQPTGGGGYYLTNTSSYHNAGTTNIDPILLLDLQGKTTYAPNSNFQGVIATNCTFSPQVSRDNSGMTVDLGYHYDPIDYALSITLSNATATILPGTVLAGMGFSGAFYLRGNAVFNSIGTPTGHIAVVRYNSVQEQSSTNWESTNWFSSLYNSGDQGPASAINCRFTDWYAMINLWHFAPFGNGGLPINLQDVQLLNGGIQSFGQTFLVTNSLFLRSALYMSDAVGYSGSLIETVSNTFCNCLFKDGVLVMNFTNTDPGIWTFRENLVDETNLGSSYGVPMTVASNNAYVNPNYVYGGLGSLLPNNNDQILSVSPAYQTGTLGQYYYPYDQTNLINMGSRTAAAAGLYHYTVTANNAIEGNNTVSIGFHYVATDAYGNPLDSDGDGLPDYLKDSNGNGLYDAGDLANWLDPFNIFDQGFSLPNSISQQVRLGYWKFDNTSYTNQAGYSPLAGTSSLLTNVPDWSGNAVSLNNLNSQLDYPTSETGNWTNFDCANGTIRFWFQPNWSTGGLPVADGGRFFQRGDFNSSTGGMFLNLLNISNLHNAMIQFEFGNSQYQQGNSFQTGSTNGVAINFQAGHWYQMALTYSPSNIALYTNGALLATGNLPPISLHSNTNLNGPVYEVGNGLSYYSTISTTFGLGNYPSLSCGLLGQFDELETFNYPMSPQEIAAGFPTFAGNSSNAVMADTYYIGRSDMLQTNVDGVSLSPSNIAVPCRLGYWRFDSPYLNTEQGQLPLTASDVSQPNSWSGTALSITSVADSHVTYADVGTNGWANINCRRGSLRFWFKPNWNSAPNAPFVYMGNVNPSISAWQLSVNSSSQVIFSSASNSAAFPYLTSSALPFNSTNWIQLVLTYGPTNTALYTNGSLAASGPALTNWPSLPDRQLGLVIGNTAAVNNPINGQFEEMETFNYQLDPVSISSNFLTVQSVDGNLDGIPDILQDITLLTSQPFLGAPVTITGTVEAEQFDRGGAGVAYHNTLPYSSTGYRSAKLDIVPCNDLGGGYCLTNMAAGEWANYTINVLVPGTYMVETRVAGIGVNGVFQCEFTNNTFSNSTGPLVVTTTNWTNMSMPVTLPSGVLTMKLHVLTNSSTSGSTIYMGCFNYISVYPYWTPPTVGTSVTTIDGATLYTNWTYGAALSNANTIQQAINGLPSAGGTVKIPAGIFYVAQSSPNELNDAFQNAAVTISANNIAITGVGKTNTVLIGYNRATTLFCLGKDFYSNSYQCDNFVLSSLTIQGQPHWAVSTNNATNIIPDSSSLQEGGTNDLIPGATNGSIMGVSTAFYGKNGALSSYNIEITNCQFLHGLNSITIQAPFVTNVMIRHCDFNMWDATSTNFGNVGIFAQGYNIEVIENTYNGNNTLVPSTNQPVGYFNTNNYVNLAPAGLAWLQLGGNFFVARNAITNYGLEAIQISGGPSSVVGNNFYTLLSDQSCCALDDFASTNFTGGNGTFAGFSTCFVGNLIYGGRQGVSPQGNDSLPYTLTSSGNFLTLAPAFDQIGDIPGAAVNVDNCLAANVFGNTLASGGLGFLYQGGCSNALVINNNFSGVTYRGLGYGTIGDFLNTAQIFNNILGEGSTFHIQSTYTNSFGWFLRGNTFLNATSNSVAPFYDPISPVLHVSN